MAYSKEEIERSIINGDVALGHIKSRRFHAQPRNYEVWYSYVGGFYDSLSNSINDLLSKKGTISQDDLDQIYDQYLSPTRISKEIDRVSAQVVGELEQMVSMVEDAAHFSSRNLLELGTVNDELRASQSPEKLRAITRQLTTITETSVEKNQTLEQQLKYASEQLSQVQTHLELVRNETFTDPLTTLYNRKYFDGAMVKCMDESLALGKPLSILVADIDHFKKFNDVYGHLTGDQVLRLVSAAIKQNVKGQDLACRYGGEEFIVILPDTALRSAVAAAENIRRAVMNKELVRRSTGETLGRITLSIGVSTFHEGDSALSLIERADQCLYAAKAAGRNRVLCETDPEVHMTPAARNTAA